MDLRYESYSCYLSLLAPSTPRPPKNRLSMITSKYTDRFGHEVLYGKWFRLRPRCDDSLILSSKKRLGVPATRSRPRLYWVSSLSCRYTPQTGEKQASTGARCGRGTTRTCENTTVMLSIARMLFLAVRCWDLGSTIQARLALIRYQRKHAHRNTNSAGFFCRAPVRSLQKQGCSSGRNSQTPKGLYPLR